MQPATESVKQSATKSSTCAASRNGSTKIATMSKMHDTICRQLEHQMIW